MSRVVDTLRRVVGSGATAPAGPAPIDLKAEYVQAIAGFLAASRQYNGQFAAYHWRDKLRSIRRRADEDGHGERMEKAWIEPPEHLSAEVLAWYEAATNHALHGGVEPGAKPLHQDEPEFWLQRYRALVANFLREHRAGNRAATGHTANQLAQLPRLAAVRLGEKFNKVFAHLGPVPGFVDDEASLAAWGQEVTHRLEHGVPSGKYVPAQMPQPFRRLVDEQRHSAVVLLIQHGPHSIGARVVLDPGISCELVEAGKATWCDPQNVPVDPRPPVEREPEPDWRKVTILRETRTASRHVRHEGEVCAVPPDEADELVFTNAAEFWMPPAPPPPPPPRPITVFGDAEA